MKPPRLLYVISEDWFFYSHFIERALAAREAGFDVVVAANFTSLQQQIESTGIRTHALSMDRGSLNPIHAARVVAQLSSLIRKEAPDLVHAVALKPIIFTGIAALWARRLYIINAPVGMGFIYTSNNLAALALRPVVNMLLLVLLNPNQSRVVFENPDDLNACVSRRYVRQEDAVLIRGAGVDIDRFKPSIAPPGVPCVILVARMLRDKGIYEFVKAAELLRGRGRSARYLLVGAPDPLNRATIDERQLIQWAQDGIVEWLGPRSDIPELLAASHIACLPSYCEGLPKSLLEALAAGLPVVTTDVPGCREVVTEDCNGYLVPPRNAEALAQAIEKLVIDPTLRQAMGRESRLLAESQFSREIVCSKTVELYRAMLGSLPAGNVR
jgi:glycosyltransferase involved in cell wall biosynthesis